VRGGEYACNGDGGGEGRTQKKSGWTALLLPEGSERGGEYA